MPRSMTGFGRASRETPHGRLVAEIRAVNARFNESRVRLPAEALELELQLRERIRSALARGKIDCTVRLEPLPGAQGGEVNADALRRTFEELHRATAGLPLADGVTLEAVLRSMPREDASAELWRSEEFAAEVTSALDEALDALTDARSAEGERIAAFLGEQLGQIDEAVAEVRRVAPQVAERYGERLRLRLDELAQSQGLEIDQGRIEQELVLFAQRADVTEELDRLAAHCEAFREQLALDEPVGRRMDFQVQEILREVNTLGSKAKDTGILGRVIDLKVVVEQMREQVQNVE
ncbi:YicC family protein [Candidatus Sumerlaeota bacterium]|nr:YicC family protein [Candidatus Sumerlaeota bacterium]